MATVERHPSAQSLLDRAGAFLASNEAENQLVLGIAGTIIRDPSRYTNPWLASVHEGDEVIAVAVKTPPWQPIMTRASQPAIDALVEALSQLAHAEGLQTVPGVHATEDTAERFAQSWSLRHGLQRTRTMRLRAFQLERVTAARWAGGKLRVAVDDDVALLARWLHAFHAEAAPQHPGQDHEVAARRAIATGGMYLWDDGGPVSFAGAYSSTPSGIRIGPVYTPPELRGRGYASSVVAAVSQRMLDAGSRRCFLYTDLDNPTSNAIYTRMGYTPVSDFAEWKFTPGA